jgi:hypothetical protein
LTVHPSSSGTVLPEERYFLGNETILFTATPVAGYKFDCWILDNINLGTANPINIEMNNRNHNLKVIFQPLTGPTIINGLYSTFTLGPGGSHSVGLYTPEHSYILTVNQQKITDPNYSWNGYVPTPGSTVHVTGYVTIVNDYLGNPFYYLEVVTLT